MNAVLYKMRHPGLAMNAVLYKMIHPGLEIIPQQGSLNNLAQSPFLHPPLRDILLIQITVENPSVPLKTPIKLHRERSARRTTLIS